jgi:hypothetical protein
MAWNRRISALLLLVGLAVAGYLLRSLVPNVLGEYQQAASFHPVWGYVYLAVVGVSSLAFVTLIVWGLWTLLANTRFKDRRRATDNLAPSQMSRGQRRQEIESQLADGRTLADDGELPSDVREPIRRSVDTLEAKLRTSDSRSSPSVPFPAASRRC